MGLFSIFVAVLGAGFIFLESSEAHSSLFSSKLSVGYRVDMIQAPRDYRAQSRESQRHRGLWTLDDARQILQRYQTHPELFRSQTFFLTEPIYFSDELYNLVWSHKLGYGQAAKYPLFRSQSIVDLQPDFGYNHDQPAKNPLPPEKLFQNENDFIFLATGYLLIPESGPYEIGLLNDDGFYFQLQLGPQNQWVFSDTHLAPLHPPKAFNQSVTLSAGLYPFSLLSFEHLEASVIRLTWKPPHQHHHVLIPITQFRGSPPY